MTREQLIAAMEKATGPDHDLDLAIARWCFESGGIAGVDYDPELWLIRNGGEFTGLIDVALTLVPEGAGLHLRRYWLLRPEAAWSAHIITGVDGDVCETEALDAAAAAIAICIASLKARTP